MATIRATVALTVASGILEDRPVNVWHFTSDKAPATNTDVYDALVAFYNPLAGRLAGTIAQNGHQVKMYDLADPQPRAPFYENTFNFTSAPSGSSLPQEVAMCCSFQGNRVSGTSQARRRGRVYLGPWNSTQLSSDGRPVIALRSAIVSTAATLLADSLASGAWNWGVWSEVDQQLVSVTNGWVDDAFDTQRRRGLAPSARSTF